MTEVEDSFLLQYDGAEWGNRVLTFRLNVLPLPSTVSKDGGSFVFQTTESLSYADAKPQISHNARLRRCLALLHIQIT